MSRLMTRLDGAIAASANPVEAACHRAERAALLARHGRFDDARETLDRLHRQFDLAPNAMVSAWMSLAEGLMEHFSHLGSVAAHDRLQRAYALGAAGNDAALQALCAAWLAHMDYVQHDLDAMTLHVAQALQLAAPDHHAARARACLVAAQAYHFAQRLDLAQPWYAKAHAHATLEGDKQTVCALMHNKAWLGAHHARMADIFGHDASEAAQHIALSADSIQNYDRMVGTAALGALVPMLRAQVLTVQGRYPQALELYRAHLADARAQGLARMMSGFHADMAWCHWHAGGAQQARADAQEALRHLSPQDDADDRALAHGRLAQVFRALGDEAAADHHAGAAQADWAAHVAVQARVVAALDAALAGLQPPA